MSLPHTAVPTGRTVLSLHGLRPRFGRLREADLQVNGPERIALVGRNGAGKTTLLRTLTGELAPLALRGQDLRTGAVPSAAARCAGRGTERRGERGPDGARGHRQPHPRPARPLPVPGQARGAARGHPVGRGTLPCRPRGDDARRTGPAAADDGRADQQPGRRQCASADRCARLLRGRAADRQSRSGLPRIDRHHQVAAGRRGAAGDERGGGGRAVRGAGGQPAERSAARCLPYRPDRDRGAGRRAAARTPAGIRACR